MGVREFEAIEQGLGLAGRFSIEGRIAEGGMGTVYRARQTGLDRPVAVKHLKSALTSQPELVRRFLAEAKLAARIAHPNVVRVLDSGSGPAGFYIVYELVEGASLRDRLDQQPPLRLALDYLRQACTGLDAVHTAGAVHRDLKPENMLVDRDDTLKLADLGIARDLTGAGLRTATGMIYGTPAYMSPEQCRGEAVGPASDLYAMGVILFEVLTGRLPFDASNPMELLQAHLETPPEAPSSHDATIPANWDRLVLQTLSKQPEGRCASAAELATAIQAMAEQAASLSTRRVRRVQATSGSTSVSSGGTRSATARPSSAVRSARSRQPGPSSATRVAARARAVTAVAVPAARSTRFWLTAAAAAVVSLALLLPASRMQRGPEPSESTPAASTVATASTTRPTSEKEPRLRAPPYPLVAALQPQMLARLRSAVSSERELRASVEPVREPAPGTGVRIFEASILLEAAGQVTNPRLAVRLAGGAPGTLASTGAVRASLHLDDGATDPPRLLGLRARTERGATQPERGLWGFELEPGQLREGFNVFRLEVPGGADLLAESCDVRLLLGRAADFPRIHEGPPAREHSWSCALPANWTELFWTEHDSGRFDQSLDLARQYTSQAPSCAGAWVLLGTAHRKEIPVEAEQSGAATLLMDQGQNGLRPEAVATPAEHLRAARVAFNRALALAPASASVWYRLGETSDRLGLLDEGLRALRWSLVLEPTDWIVWLRLASAGLHKLGPAFPRGDARRQPGQQLLDLLEQSRLLAGSAARILVKIADLKGDTLSWMGRTAEAKRVRNEADALRRAAKNPR